MQSEYSTAPADWAALQFLHFIYSIILFQMSLVLVYYQSCVNWKECVKINLKQGSHISSMEILKITKFCLVRAPGQEYKTPSKNQLTTNDLLI